MQLVESQYFRKQCRVIKVLPLLYASNFLQHLTDLAVENPACVFLQVQLYSIRILVFDLTGETFW